MAYIGNKNTNKFPNRNKMTFQGPDIIQLVTRRTQPRSRVLNVSEIGTLGFIKDQFSSALQSLLIP
jgi:hypothetical protein